MDSWEKYIERNKRSRVGQKRRVCLFVCFSCFCKIDAKSSTDPVVSFGVQITFEICLFKASMLDLWTHLSTFHWISSVPKRLCNLKKKKWFLAKRPWDVSFEKPTLLAIEGINISLPRKEFQWHIYHPLHLGRVTWVWKICHNLLTVLLMLSEFYTCVFLVLLKFAYIWVLLTYNVLVSDVQQSDSIMLIHISILFQILNKWINNFKMEMLEV